MGNNDEVLSHREGGCTEARVYTRGRGLAGGGRGLSEVGFVRGSSDVRDTQSMLIREPLAFHR